MLEGTISSGLNSEVNYKTNDIRVLLKDRYTVSLFNTWMDDKSKVLIKKKNIADLTIEDVKSAIFGDKNFLNKMSV